MIVDRVSRDAVGVAIGGDVLQPLPGTSSDHTEDGRRDHVARGEVILIVARVVPSLVRAADEVDRSENGACGAIHDVCERSELPSIMPCARHHHIRAGPDDDAARLAIGHREAVDHRWNTVHRTAWEGVEGIDFIDAANSHVTADRIRVRYKEVACVGIEDGSTDTSEGDRSDAPGRCRDPARKKLRPPGWR